MHPIRGDVIAVGRLEASFHLSSLICWFDPMSIQRTRTMLFLVLGGATCIKLHYDLLDIGTLVGSLGPQRIADGKDGLDAGRKYGL